MSRWRRFTVWRLRPGLLAALVAILLLLGSARLQPSAPVPRHGGQPGSGPTARDAERPIAREGVTLAGQAVSGLPETEVRRLLEKRAGELRLAPVNARVDPATRGLIPPLAGRVLDVEATLARVRAAAPGQRVPLAFREEPPAVTLADLPPAPIYQGNPAKRAVTFLINVAWGQEHLPRMLEVLERHKVRATFFLVGKWVERFPEEARTIAEAGHEIASHGYSSAEFAGLTAEQVAAEIDRAEAAILAATGRKPRWFSPHKGEISPQLLRVARAKGYETILWSVDTVDWKKPGVDWMVERVTGGAHNGALILMHPTEQTAAALEPIILGLEKRGYRIVTLGTLLSPRSL